MSKWILARATEWKFCISGQHRIILSPSQGINLPGFFLHGVEKKTYCFQESESFRCFFLSWCLAETDNSQRLLDNDAAQHLKLKERQRFFEEVYQQDVDNYLPSAHLQIDCRKREWLYCSTVLQQGFFSRIKYKVVIKYFLLALCFICCLLQPPLELSSVQCWRNASCASVCVWMLKKVVWSKWKCGD